MEKKKEQDVLIVRDIYTSFNIFSSSCPRSIGIGFLCI